MALEPPPHPAGLAHVAPGGQPGTGPILAILALLLLLATPFQGGLGPWPGLLLQWLGLLLVGLALWRPRRAGLSVAEALLLGSLLLLPLLYLSPWPAWLHGLLSGRAAFDQALAAVDPGALTNPRPLSLYPYATETAWLHTLIPVGVFLGIRSLGEKDALKLSYLLFAVALAQVLIGLFQFATASSGVDYTLSDWVPRGGAAAGTYINRNHLAGLLAMVFPLALALFLYHFGRGPGQRQRPRGWRAKTLAALRAGGRPSLAFGLLAILLIVGIVVTRSRTGIALAMLGILLTAVLFSRRIGGGGFGLMGQVITLAIALAVTLGLAPVLDRFALGDMEKDARWPLASATFDAAGTLLPLGSGPGTYPAAFPVHQPVELGEFFINHAHNDYLEALYENGLAALALLIVFLTLAARQWTRLLAGEEWSRFRFLQIGAGIGLVLMLGHSFTDYNLHTPANLATFAFLAGLFLAPPGRLPLAHRKPKRRPRTRAMPPTASGATYPEPAADSHTPAGEPTAPAEADTPPAPAPAAPRRTRNPFDT
jgi:hypothetical protein